MRNLRALVRFLLPGLILAAIAAPAWSATYTYQGASFGTADPPWSTGGRITGSLSLDHTLPPFQPLTDISLAITALTFSDGVQTRTLDDTSVCVAEVATDGLGRIREWRLSLREAVFTPGDPQHALDTFGSTQDGFSSDRVGVGLASGVPCGPLTLTASANAIDRGTWSGAMLPPQPTTYTYQGEPYSAADPPYLVGSRTTGSLTFDRPLPRLLPLTDLRAAVASLSLDDSVEIRTWADSFHCRLEVSTDGAGQIREWRISMRERPYNPGDPQHLIDSIADLGVLGGFDQAGAGSAAADPCGPIATISPVASSFAKGTWSGGNPLPPQPTTYTYTGSPYTLADPPYVLGGQVTGSIGLAAPLPPFMPLTDVAGFLDSLSFSDGVETRTLADSFLCSVEVSTDSLGQILAWQISLRRFPYNPGDPHHAIESTGQPGLLAGGSDIAGTGVGPADPCGPMTPAPAGSNSTAGSWVSSSVPVADPTSYSYQGDPFTFAQPPYQAADSLVGSIAFLAPLPANLPLTDVRNALVELAFDDTVEPRTLADSFLCRFEVATNEAAEIVRWNVSLRRFPYNPGDPHAAIDSVGLGLAAGSDLAGSAPAPVGPCDPFALDPSAGTLTPGTWIGGGTSPLAIPAVEGWGLALLAVLLALAGMAGLRGSGGR